MLPVAIVGGGISGLAAAYFLEKSAAESGLDLAIHLMESRDRLGGVILTERADGFLLEGGPDSFLSLKPAAIELANELGLSGDLVPSNDHRRRTYVYYGGKLRELPEGLMFVVPSRVGPLFRTDLFSLFGKLRLALSAILPPPVTGDQDISVADFIRPRLGTQALERLVEPLLAAVYGADVDTLSAHAALPQLIGLEEKYGSLWRGVRTVRTERQASSPQNSLFVTLRNGVGEITDALAQRLSKTRVICGREILAVSRDRKGTGFHLQWSGGEMDAAALIVATPTHVTAKILRDLDPPLAEKLAEVTYHSSLTVSLGFPQRGFPHSLDGFGFVVPRKQGKRLIACTWVSTKFPFRCAPEQVLLRCFLGGARDPAIVGEGDSRIFEIVRQELAEIMGIRSEPSLCRIYRWEKCMPQYSTGHPRRVEQIASLAGQVPGLFLAGNGYRGIGIPDCIHSASLAASSALRHLRTLL